METYEVKLTPRALQDLDSIYAYIAQSLMEPDTALKLLSRLEDAIFSLEQLPQRGALRKTGAYANRGYRQLLIENYIAIYRVEKCIGRSSCSPSVFTPKILTRKKAPALPEPLLLFKNQPRWNISMSTIMARP